MTTTQRPRLVPVPTAAEQLELSFVIPCLNEAETLAVCIQKAQGFLRQHGIRGEVVVGDNGSTDGSQRIAEEHGARVIPVAERGYGAALMGAIEASRGTFIIMGDADDSYDFSAVEPFLEELRNGADLVMGDRIGGTIQPGAMPFLNRYVGNPILSGLGRLFFGAPVRDFHCGLRGFRRDAYDQLDLHTPGMEFASEMIAKAALHGQRVAEVPITFYKDGRSRAPHLRRWRDGWRHLRFMLFLSPTWLFMIPGLVLLVGGVLASVALVPGPVRVGPVRFDIHTLLVAGASAIIGLQLIVFALFSKAFAIGEGLLPPSPWLERVFRVLTLERGILAGLALALGGLGLLVLSVVRWSQADFGDLQAADTMRLVIPAVVSLTLGVQVVFSSFFIGVLGMRRGERHSRGR